MADELISREVAIEKTEAFCDVFETNWTDEKVLAWIKHLPSVDAVSRGVYEQIKWERDIAMEQLEEHGIAFGAKKAPTINPERPKGEWEEWYPPMHMIMTGEEMLYRCSACDAKYADVEGYKFCPYCGADMRGE